MTTYNSNTAARKMIIILVCIFMFFSLVAATCDEGGVQDTGEQVVTDVLLTTSELEQAVYDQVCQPGNLSNPDCQ